MIVLYYGKYDFPGQLRNRRALKLEALYEDYRELNNWQHEYMADHYTNITEEAIRDLYPNLNDNAFLNRYDNITLWNWDKVYEYVFIRRSN